MKTKVLFIIILLPIFIFGQQGLINNGMKIVVIEGSSIMVSHDYVNQSLDDNHHGEIVSDGTIEIGGDWYNNASSGSVFGSFNDKGNVNFASSTSQIIGGTKNTNFENLSLNNNGLVLDTDVEINGNISMFGGILELGDFNLSLSATSEISGSFSNASMIATNGSGVLRQLLTGAANLNFPLGDISSEKDYSPLELQVISFSGNADSYVSVRVENNTFSLLTNNTDYINRYWTLSGEGVNAINYDATFSFVDADIVGNENNLYATSYIGNTPTFHDVVNASSNTFEVNSNASFAIFTAADKANGILQKVDKEGFIVYPNPNNGIFRIQANDIVEDELSFEILNEMGMLLEQGKINSFEYNTQEGIELDIQNYRKGCYIIRIFTNTQLMQKKIIIY